MKSSKIQWTDDTHNFWLGISVEDQAAADKRIPVLLTIPAKVRFLSVEPMLGPVDFKRHLTGSIPFKPGYLPTPYKRIDWVIFGGESGPGARACNVEWVRDGVRQCREAVVACFVKQLGANVIDNNTIGADTFPQSQCWPDGTKTDHINVSLRDRKGGDWSEWPEDLIVREFPKT